MESPHFDLKASVDDYILLIQNQGALTGSDAKELTNHLLDATDELCKGGLSEEEAFIIATKRLGNEETLTQEYAKVNPSLSTNKVWSYLFIGFNLFYILPSIVVMMLAGLYTFMHVNFERGLISIVVITASHLLLSGLIIFLVRKKVSISGFFESQVQKNPFRIVLLTFLPHIVIFLLRPVFVSKFHFMPATFIFYPLREFNGTLVEFTFYLAILSIIGGVLALIFSFRKPELVTLRSLFEKPSMLFLVCFGILVEMLSASSRTIPTSHVLYSSIIFGIIYLGASYLIARYNQSAESLKYLAIFSLFGLISEISVGIDADLSRGDTYNTVYYSIALLTGLFVGWKIGEKFRNMRFRTRES